MIYGSETRPVKEDNVIRQERNHASMVWYMCTVRPSDRISAV